MRWLTLNASRKNVQRLTHKKAMKLQPKMMLKVCQPMPVKIMAWNVLTRE
jgi:hypothetical protein